MNELFLKMVLDGWRQYIKRTGTLLGELPDERLLLQIAPGKNTGKYLLGHLTAVHDRMLPLLRLGKPLYPELHDPFESKPDGEHIRPFDLDDLRLSWKEVNESLDFSFGQLTSAEWLERHTAVSEEDFVKEPHRNRLNVVINRTNHLAWHYGQLLLLK